MKLFPRRPLLRFTCAFEKRTVKSPTVCRDQKRREKIWKMEEKEEEIHERTRRGPVFRLEKNVDFFCCANVTFERAQLFSCLSFKAGPSLSYRFSGTTPRFPIFWTVRGTYATRRETMLALLFWLARFYIFGIFATTNLRGLFCTPQRPRSPLNPTPTQPPHAPPPPH